MKVKIEKSIMMRCPYCGECRSMMMLISKGRHVAFHIDYADVGDEITCVSCKKEFER